MLRWLGCRPLRCIDPGAGSSVHYAGTLPFSDRPLPLAVSPSGQLWGSRAVYVVDAAPFRYLPAKGPTLTIMANAHRVASAIARVPRTLDIRTPSDF
ncbi:MAG: GMC oxidoreductase [Gemmatimonadales bacterium]